MQHQIHQRQAVRVLHMLHAIEGAPVELLLLLLIQLADLVVLADPVQRRNREAAGARRRILDHILDRGLHHGHHRINQRPWREILAGAGFLLLGILLQQPLIQIAQSLLAGAVPIQLVELAHQLVERGGLLDE